MALKRKGLGRGLDALLGGALPAAADEASEELREIPVDLIQPGKFQPRTRMNAESLQDLADSIKAQGLVQPIVVRPLNAAAAQPAAERHYEIIAGERRWRAAQIAGLHQVPAVVRDVPDRAAIAIALIENIQRENLNPLEEAQALQRLIGEFNMTHQQAAEAVGRSRAAVTNLLRLLELTAEVKELVERGELEMGHARALLALKGTAQTEAARRVVARHLSVRDTENLVRRLLKENGGSSKSPRRVDPNIRQLETELTGKLGAKVSIEAGSGGKGRLIIQYTSLDELDGILSRIR
ncbi:MAG: ParB/RepB/Spo0J family partition protein [Gammaproteobacteria bacterium]|nr:ParB/RepB/Spo0J family partition protein [Gammaproteobacteria bacterium]MBU6509410.1 ParB/RepB/Spo0J family partition protein [Gammaproteobacteria bacterium]MDE1983782.1 ParB/RepB/Spo0J family partition protein [Gammaproteobacteria bacterium]MDE2107759.1 ParB/RepB/Spo0J family partition protein [Gammaproteobacteria bacterium]MDE2460747.1 ParB/RepB/Spo0J family partition protein [Gammaproteobacteria bacterium]